MTVVNLHKQPKGMSEAEWNTRVDLAACYRLIHHFGMDELIWNHISARVPGDEDHFLINPFGYRYDEICASNLVKIDKDGNTLAGEETNVTGFVIHSAIHMRRREISCVLHTHTEGGRFVACLEDGFVPMTQDAFTFYNDITYHDYEGLSDDLDERERLAESLGECNQMVMRNHGLLTVGKTVSEAFIRMYYLEGACKIQMRIQSSGRPYKLPAPEIMQKAYNQAHAAFAPGHYEWPAMLRLAEKLDPAYKE